MVAITKADMLSEHELDTARERITQQLLEHELVCEDFGGDTQVVTVSAKTGEGMEELLEAIQLQADVRTRVAWWCGQAGLSSLWRAAGA